MARATAPAASKLLKRYLKDEGLSLRVFADLFGMTHTYVHRLTLGVMRPSLEIRMAIATATGGKVPAATWILDVEWRAASRRARTFLMRKAKLNV